MTRPRHPQPAVLATQLRQLAALLDRHGTRTLVFASLLAARGYPTGGNTPGRSSDTTSSTERAALNPHPWASIDDRYQRQLQLAWEVNASLQATIVLVLAHAPTTTDKPIAIGQGNCEACDTFCIGDGGNNRLRSKLCHRCYEALRRYRQRNPHATRSDFITDTKRDHHDHANKQVNPMNTTTDAMVSLDRADISNR